jgi:hypothetical protein
MTLRESIGILFSTLVVTPLAAQTASLEPVTPLRVSARGFTFAGDLVRWDADSLVVHTGVAGSPAALRAQRSIAAGDILRVDALISGSRGHNAARGALWGAVIGGLLGGVAGAADPPGEEKTQGFLIGGLVLGGIGAGVGALVGMSSPTEEWTVVSAESPQR